ncbi:MAG: GNAT family N-acetyltransferase [Actinobacteria bacterium]|nr:GNAT family N-acetyltransferase [Actinomycetota bacterium]
MSTNDEVSHQRGLASRHSHKTAGPDLSGYGVTLSRMTDADVDDLAAAAAATPEDAFRWTFVARDRDVVRATLDYYAETNRLIYVVRVEGRVVGQTGYYDLDFFLERGTPTGVEVGHTWYTPEARGTTVNPACKLLLFTHAFETWNVDRIAMRTDVRNAVSRAAMLKLGMTFEGIRRRHMIGSDGTRRDSAYFSALAEEWPTIKQGLLARLGPSA